MASRASSYRSVAPALVEQRAATRHRVAVTRASVRGLGANADDATLQDLSTYGCRIDSPLRHREGERLWLRFDGGMPIGATVAWYDRGLTGCRFDAPLDRATVRSLTLVIC